MFSVNDFSAHAFYVMDLVAQRQRGRYWYGLFDHAQRHMAAAHWDAALRALKHALETAEATLANSEETLARYRGAYELLVGACYVGQKQVEESLIHYKYADATFRDGADDYGRAVTFFARGLAYHADQKWRNAYAAYTQAVDVLAKPIPQDDVLRRMRIDLQERIVQVHEGMFERLDDLDPPITPPPPFGGGGGTAPDTDPGSDTAGNAAASVVPPDDAEETKAPIIGAGSIRLHPVFQDISAGPGIWLQEYKRFEQFVEIEEIKINGQSHWIKPITSTGSRVLDLKRNIDYGVFHVVGDSMNAADILPGDYVLAENIGAEPSADFNDQILCLLLNMHEDEGLVIKWYKFDGVNVTLTSENTDDKYASKEYRKSEVVILGKVVAVLKKIE